MCGRAQRVLLGKIVAWVLDYGGHGQRFGSANWDWPEAIEFDRREKLRLAATELAAQIASGRHDPKCEVRPDNFMDLTEAAVDLFDVMARPLRNGKCVRLFYVHALGYTEQYVHADTGWAARFLRFFGVPEYQALTPPPTAASPSSPPRMFRILAWAGPSAALAIVKSVLKSPKATPPVA